MSHGKSDDKSLPLRLLLTSSSAVVAECATFPIDITKTRLQLQGELGARQVSGLRRAGAFQVAVGIVRDEGVSGLYRGLSPAILRHVFYSSLRIVTYEHLREAAGNPEELSVGAKAVLGATAGIIGQVVASPADLVKVRMQADGRLAKMGQPRRYTGIGHAFGTIVKNEGLPGLWRGVGPNVYRAALVNMGELAAYDEAKQVVLRGGMSDGIVTHTLASMLSGLSATVLSCPADVVKTRMMNQLSGGPTSTDVAGYKSSLDCLVRTVQAEGVLALWKGFWPTWGRLGPWQLVFWVSYEQMRKASGLASF